MNIINLKYIILFWFFSICYSSYAIERPDFLSAVAEDKITPTIQGNSVEGRTYGEATEISIQNNTGETIETVLEKGTILESRNPNTQDLVVTKDLTMRVGAYEYLDPPVNIFCIELNKNEPTIYDFYKPPSRKASGILMKLINYIDDSNLHDVRGAQLAIWSLTDGLTAEKAIFYGYGSKADIKSGRQILKACNINNAFTKNISTVLYLIGMILYTTLVVIILLYFNKTR